jgi:hypothetical protein
MESTKENNGICINLTEDEALVLLEWLSKFNREEHSLLFQDRAEERILFDLEATLEKIVPEVFSPSYKDMLSKAREKIRDVA